MKTDQYLEHHGVKGQKWGVKNGPPYPISSQRDTKAKNGEYYINKGTKLVRYSPRKNERKSMVGKYASYRRSDSSVYKKLAQTNDLGFKTHKHIYEHSINTVDRALVVSGKKTTEMVLKRIGDKNLEADFKTMQKYGYYDDDKSFSERNKIADKYNDVLSQPKHHIGSAINSYMYSEKGKAFIEELSSKYDAMVDPEDYTYGFSRPLILLNNQKFAEEGQSLVKEKLKNK